MPDIREEFEEYIAVVREAVKAKGFKPLDDAIEKWMFHAWQASRAALKVELPRPYGQSLLDIDPDFEQYNRGIRDCKEALQKAGIEVM